MNQRRNLAWLAAGIVISALSSAACSGSDVYLDGRQSQQGPLTLGPVCPLAPGEDVCSRSFENAFENADPTARAAALGALSTVAEFAGRAREGRDALDRACGELLDSLGAPRPALDPKRPTSERTQLTCSAASAAAAKVNRKAFTITVGEASCSTKPPPACASARAKPRITCKGPAVTFTMNSGATARDQVEAAALARMMATMGAAKSGLEGLSDLTGELTANSQDLLSAPGCVATAVSLTSAAVAEVQEVVSLSATLSATIQPDL